MPKYPVELALSIGKSNFKDCAVDQLSLGLPFSATIENLNSLIIISLFFFSKKEEMLLRDIDEILKYFSVKILN